MYVLPILLALCLTASPPTLPSSLTVLLRGEMTHTSLYYLEFGLDFIEPSTACQYILCWAPLPPFLKPILLECEKLTHLREDLNRPLEGKKNYNFFIFIYVTM